MRLPISRLSCNQAWLVRGGIGIILCCSCAAAYWLATVANRPPPTDERLYVDPGHLDFREAWETDSFHWTLPIQNRSTEEVQIDGFAANCTCVALKPGSMVLPPGE